MYVCLCHGVTNVEVGEAVAHGADSTRKVAEATQAGATCGRCKATIRQIIEAASPERHSGPRHLLDRLRHRDG
jgi:bacterioferritin-associated ferredoxin